MKFTRNRSFKPLCALIAASAWLCTAAWTAPAGPAESEQAKAKLAAVRARIAALTGRLGDELKQRDSLGARLREAELVITAKRRQLDGLRAAQVIAERRRSDLRVEQSREQDALKSERESLAALSRAAYMMGREEQLKLLLNQDDAAGLGRTLTYYGYLAAARSSKIEVIQGHVNRLQQFAAEIDQQTERLNALEGDARREMAALEHARADRADALSALSKQVASGNQQLANLKREEAAVESLVADLARVMQDFPADPTQSFERMRGKLPWPVVGRVTARYQEAASSSASGVRSNGEMIEAARGAKVRAPYFGRVVYADWLQGLGLLLIIGHSGGYMTLYGHAEVLYKSVGDKVAPGDVIAALSDTGGAAPQLYFEIRAGRKPVDPRVWLRTNP